MRGISRERRADHLPAVRQPQHVDRPARSLRQLPHLRGPAPTPSSTMRSRQSYANNAASRPTRSRRRSSPVPATASGRSRRQPGHDGITRTIAPASPLSPSSVAIGGPPKGRAAAPRCDPASRRESPSGTGRVRRAAAAHGGVTPRGEREGYQMRSRCCPRFLDRCQVGGRSARQGAGESLGELLTASVSKSTAQSAGSRTTSTSGGPRRSTGTSTITVSSAPASRGGSGDVHAAARAMTLATIAPRPSHPIREG